MGVKNRVQNLRNRAEFEGAVKMANAKGLQAEKAGKGVVGCGGHLLRTPRAGGAGGAAAFKVGQVMLQVEQSGFGG